MMKKFWVLILIMAVSFTILSGCNKVPDTNNEPNKREITKSPDQSENLSPKPDEKIETRQVVLYFSDKDVLNTYRIKKEIKVRKDERVEKAALEAWIKGPDNDELIGLIPSNVIVEYVEEVNGVAHVSFSKEIQQVNLGSTGELMFAEQLAMIMEQFGFEQTQILVEGKMGETLLGHLYTGEPIEAKDSESYRWIDERESNKIVLQNTAFRVFEPTPNTAVKNRIVVRGVARVFEATFLYEFEDGHNVLDGGVTMTSAGAPEWGEFEIVINFDPKEVANNSGTIILYEASPKDGSRVNELKIPVKVMK